VVRDFDEDTDRQYGDDEPQDGQERFELHRGSFPSRSCRTPYVMRRAIRNRAAEAVQVMRRSLVSGVGRRRRGPGQGRGPPTTGRPARGRPGR
jgi:hypothetical protein